MDKLIVVFIAVLLSTVMYLNCSITVADNGNTVYQHTGQWYKSGCPKFDINLPEAIAKFIR